MCGNTTHLTIDELNTISLELYGTVYDIQDKLVKSTHLDDAALIVEVRRAQKLKILANKVAGIRYDAERDLGKIL